MAEREERVGLWRTQWLRDESNAWRALQWEATEETVSRAREPIFIDVTSQALGQTESYKNQMAHGVDYWRTVLDGACGMDVYGNNGLAVGDFDNDGFDDLYVCQPAGLPNRLYRNRGDGTFEDVTEQAGVGVSGWHRLRAVRRFREQGAAGSSGGLRQRAFAVPESGKWKIFAEARRFPVHASSAGNFYRTRRSPTMTATDDSTFISAFTAITWVWTSITIRLLTSTRATALRTFCFTTKETPPFTIAPRLRD